MPTLQQIVLFKGSVEREAYGDHVIEVKFQQPVQIASISISHGKYSAAADKTMFRGGWATDLFSASAARYVSVLPVMPVPSQNVPALEAFATDHLVLHGKFHSVVLTVSGYALAAAAQQIKAEADRHCDGELPVTNQVLSLPASTPFAGLPGPPQLHLSPAPLVPLPKLPGVFVHALTSGVQYWLQVRLSHSRIENNPPNGQLDQLTALADAVLAAARGKPGALQAAITAAQTTDEAAAVSGWSAVQDDALDMAASWCSMLASSRTHTPYDMEVGVAGLAASILLASCPVTAAQFLAITGDRQQLAGAAAVRGVLSIPKAPPLISRYGLGLLELLLSSCPVVACSVLLGPLTPVLATTKQHSIKQEPEAEHMQHNGPHLGYFGGGVGIPLKQELSSSPVQRKSSVLSQGIASVGHNSHRKRQRDSDSQQERQSRSSMRRTSGAGAVAAATDVQEDTQLGSLPAVATDDVGLDMDAVADVDDGEDDEDGGLYGGLDYEDTYSEEDMKEQQQDWGLDGAGDGTGQQEAADDDGMYDALASEGSEEKLQLDADDEDMEQDGAFEIGAYDLANKYQEVQPAGDPHEINHQEPEDGNGMMPIGHTETGNNISDKGRQQAAGDEDVSGTSTQDDAGHELRKHQNNIAQGDSAYQDRSNHRHQGDDRRIQGAVGDRGRVGPSTGGNRSDGRGAGGQEAELLLKRRRHAVKLYSGVVELALQPRREDIAASCALVLSRLKAWECVTVLRSTVGPMLDGTVNALLLPVQDFQQQMHKVNTAVADLAALVLLLTPAEPVYHSSSNSLQQSEGSSKPSRRQQADTCVLQLLLSCRVAELLAALLDIAAVHGSRLAQQQADQQQGEPSQAPASSECSHQLSSLCENNSQLLASIQVLLSRIMSSPAGWSYLRAAGSGLAALADAVFPDTKVSLNGGQPDLTIPRDPVSGRPQLRQQLLQGSYGPTADGSSSVSADLSLELQRILLLAQAVGELQQQQQQQASTDQHQGQAGSSRLSEAVQTLVQCCLSSGVGREAAVAALASCPQALQQLVVLMSSRGRVLTAVAGWQQQKPTDELAGLLDADDDALLDGFGSGRGVVSGAAVRLPQSPPYESLYAPDLLLAVVSEQHPDIIQQWLPYADEIAAAVAEEGLVQQRHGSAAAAVAFPGSSSDAVGNSNKGLPLAAESGVTTALVEKQKTVLLQLQGYSTTAQQLLACWKQGDGTGSGTASFLVKQLQQLLPPLVAVSSESAAAAGGLSRAGSRDVAETAQAVANTATSSGTTSAPPVLQGAAAVAGAPPPWGKDVTTAAATQFVNSPRDLSAALSALNIVAMLLRGPSAAVRTLAAALADQPAERTAMKPAMNPAVALNPNGALGPGGSAESWAGGAAYQDGLSSEVLLSELLQGVVLDVLDRALRSGTAALEASSTDFMWEVRGGELLDDLKRLQARSSAALLLLSASSATAALMLLLAEADVGDLSGCSLLDAIICAHTAVVTSQEGLSATLPTPELVPHLIAAAAAAPSASAALSAAAARSGSGVCHGLLLSARQQLSVCLCCWQRCGWWPDSVGALLGQYPSASEVMRTIAAEEAEARSRGDRSAPPAPAVRQGPRQMFAALLALGDLCPSEWPPAGASKKIAAAAAAAAAEDQAKSTVVFERPSHVQLRFSIAASCEAHMSALSHLVSWGAAADSKLVRTALLRLCVRAGSVGGGMSPFLVPLLLQVLREQLDAAVKGQQQLKAHINKLAAAGQGLAAQQRALQAALPTTPQLSDSRRMIELLIPLASRPGFKTALLEHKVVGMLAKYLHKLAMRCKEEPDNHAAIGLVLQLMATLCNPDISLAPHVPREQREVEDTPLLHDARDMVAALLASSHVLSADNMAAAASLLVGPCAAAGGKGLAEFPRGQAAVRQGALRWFQSQAPDAASYMQGNAFIPEAVPASVSWAAGRLAEVAEHSTDASHKASCDQIAAMLRQLPTTTTPDTEADPAIKTSMRFAKAVQESVAAAQSSSSSSSEDLASLLDQPAVLLACDAVAAEFMAVCAVGAHTQRQKRFRAYGEKLASEPSAMSSLFGGAGLLPPRRPRTHSRPVQWLQTFVTHQGQPFTAAAAAAAGAGVTSALLREDSSAQGADEVPEGVPVVPTMMAPRRSAAVFKHGESSRKASMHVDDYEAQKQRFPPAASSRFLPPSPAPYEPVAGPSGAVPNQPLGRSGAVPPPLPPPAALHGGPPFQGIGNVVQPEPRMLPAAPGSALAAASGMRGDGVGHWAAMPGQRPLPGSTPAAASAAFNIHQQPKPLGAVGASNMWQQQQAGRAPPTDPRQQLRVQQQQQLPPVTDLGRSESPDSGSGLLGGLAGESPDYAGRSPSYHSSPEGSGAGPGQEWPILGQQQSQEEEGDYKVSEV